MTSDTHFAVLVTFQVNQSVPVESAGECSSLQSNLLLTCFAPFSSGFVHNLTNIDFESMPLQKRTAMLSQVCSAYLIYNQCVTAVMGPSGKCKSKAMRQASNNTSLDGAEVERVLKPICTQQHLMAPTEQHCIDELPTLPLTTQCSISHGHHVFRVFSEKAPDFTFGDPESCYLSQGLIAVTQCLEQAANATCNSPAIRSALSAHSHVYSATFAKCNAPVDTSEGSSSASEGDFALSFLYVLLLSLLSFSYLRFHPFKFLYFHLYFCLGSGATCSKAQEDQFQLCHKLFEPFFTKLIGNENVNVPDQTATEWCTFQFLYRHCMGAAAGPTQCHSSNDTIIKEDLKFSSVCENRRGSSHNRNVTKSCPYDIDMNEALVNCTTTVKTSFSKAAESGFRLEFPAACNSIRDLGLMENCMKPKITSQCGEEFGQYVDKHIKSLRATLECSPGGKPLQQPVATSTNQVVETAANLDTQNTTDTTTAPKTTAAASTAPIDATTKGIFNSN